MDDQKGTICGQSAIAKHLRPYGITLTDTIVKGII
jgi:hypothetical protein